MKIKIGKTYRDRSGRKILALAINPLAEKGSNCELVAVEEDGGSDGYGMDGKYLGGTQESGRDLVEEWVEPEDAPLEIDDIEPGIAFKPKSREDAVKYYPQVASQVKVTFLEFSYSYRELKSDWLMQLPGTTEWVPCSKKSIASS